MLLVIILLPRKWRQHVLQNVGFSPNYTAIKATGEYWSIQSCFTVQGNRNVLQKYIFFQYFFSDAYGVILPQIWQMDYKSHQPTSKFLMA
jgi:hypothetical protein